MDYVQALRWYRLASKQGDLKASFEFVDLCSGSSLDNLPDVCAKVSKLAQSEYGRISGGIRTLAEKGDAEAQFMLSVIIQSRLPVKEIGSKLSPEEREANKWLRDAASGR